MEDKRGRVVDPVCGVERELTRVVNRASAENGSNTPDFILGGFLASVLAAADEAIRERDRWYGVKLSPGAPAGELAPATSFVMVAEDRHFGVRVFVFSEREAALAAARTWASGRARNLGDVREEQTSAYLLCLHYSPDDADDVVWVQERRVDAPVQV